jgi:hypothetical protein
VNWKRETESAALTERAFHPNLAAMSLNDALRDVETETDAASIARGNLNVPLEDCFQLVGRNSGARVADSEADVVSDVFGTDDDPPLWWGELDRITQKVGKHLENPCGIKRDVWQRRRDLCHK